MVVIGDDFRISLLLKSTDPSHIIWVCICLYVVDGPITIGGYYILYNERETYHCFIDGSMSKNNMAGLALQTPAF